MDNNTNININRWQSFFAFAFIPIVLAPLWVLVWSKIPSHCWLVTIGGFDLLLVVIAATAMDIRKMRIPNWITYPAVVSAVLTNAAWSAGVIRDPLSIVQRPICASELLGAVGLMESLVGMTGCFFALFWTYAIGGRGAGDVKLAAAIGAWMGLKCGISAILFGVMLAASVLLAIALWRFGAVAVLSFLFKRFLRKNACAAHGNSEIDSWFRRPTPMAPALTLGILFVFLCGSVFD